MSGGRDGLARTTARRILAPKEQMARYLVVIERTKTGCSAYSPDVLGCIATARTRAQVVKRIREALEFHIEGLREEGLPPPEPGSDSTFVVVPAA